MKPVQHPGTYTAKIMLVGEYGVVAGGSALTIPFHRFTTKVRSLSDIPTGKQPDAEMSGKVLEGLYHYLRDLPEHSFHAGPDMELFSAGLNRYWLDTDIPVGYGLGSSGTVSAAVYDLFFPDAGKTPLPLQKEDLALIESFFHGKSSGVDALTCHAGVPLYFQDPATIHRVSLDLNSLPGGYRFFLLDSGEKSDTGPLVRHFLERMKDPGFEAAIRNEYLPLNRKLIETLLGERDADIGMLVGLLSDFQFRYFRKMIPEKMADAWIEGQLTNHYYLKLNGSGGGSLLGIVHHTLAETLEKRWKTNLIWIP
ncbi:MAG: mevalonate kinase family protein [Bacteroidota bacterium]